MKRKEERWNERTEEMARVKERKKENAIFESTRCLYKKVVNVLFLVIEYVFSVHRLIPKALLSFNPFALSFILLPRYLSIFRVFLEMLNFALWISNNLKNIAYKTIFRNKPNYTLNEIFRLPLTQHTIHNIVCAKVGKA